MAIAKQSGPKKVTSMKALKMTYYMISKPHCMPRELYSLPERAFHIIKGELNRYNIPSLLTIPLLAFNRIGTRNTLESFQGLYVLSTLSQARHVSLLDKHKHTYSFAMLVCRCSGLDTSVIL